MAKKSNKASTMAEDVQAVEDIPFPNPDVPVSDERAYYRDDLQLVFNAISGIKSECRIFFGLRRYGKTCFLKRIERVCNQGLYGFSPKNYRAVMIEAGGSPAENASRLDGILRSLNPRAKNHKTIVLIDDLQQLDGKSGSVAEDDIRHFRMKLAEALEVGKQNGNIQVVLCEPTNFSEWLEGVHGPVGASFYDMLNEYVTPTPTYTLPPFTGIGRLGEAYKLLSAEVDGVARVELDPELANQLCHKLGGNPWLLSHAHKYVKQGLSTKSDIDTIINKVKKTAMIGKEKENLGRIYGSLSREERFFVRLAHDAYKGGRESLRWISTGEYEKSLLTDGKLAGRLLPALGVLDGSLGHGFTIMPVLEEYLNGELAGYILGSTKEDQDVWHNVLNNDPPNSARSRRFVIHQMSDLMLEEDSAREGPWKAYVEKLARFKAQATKDPDNNRCPDMIVICGNLVTLPCAGDRASQTCERQYERKLNAAAQQLRELTNYMRPMGNAGEASTKQILLLPGIFDLDWNKGYRNGEDSPPPYAATWRRTFADFSLAGDIYEFAPFALKILPFDTASLDGVYEHGGEEAVKNLKMVRGRLQQKFSSEWNLIVNNLGGDKGVAERLSRLTMNYLVDISTDDAESAEFSVPDPTFRFRGGSTSLGSGEGKSGEFKTYFADAGFIRSEERNWLTSQAGDRTNGEQFVLAVTHHHPHLRRGGGVVEFYDGYDFRQHLARAGIRYVLHGHSSCQQVLSERVTLKAPGRNARAASTIEMIGSGSFSAVLGSDANPLRDTPGYNEITLDRNNPDSTVQLTVHFWEWDEKAGCVVERGEVAPHVFAG